jgi:hypothetical protein
VLQEYNARVIAAGEILDIAKREQERMAVLVGGTRHRSRIWTRRWIG